VGKRNRQLLAVADDRTGAVETWLWGAAWSLEHRSCCFCFEQPSSLLFWTWACVLARLLYFYNKTVIWGNPKTSLNFAKHVWHT
jgi:hypothetical protein